MQIKIQPTKITKELILSHISEETLMEHYLGIPVKKGIFRSPLRTDNNPTCSFDRDKYGRLVFKDFNGSFYGDAFEVVKRLYNVPYYEALNIIANDFGIIEIPRLVKHPKIIEYSNTQFEESGPSNIQIEVQPFSEQELKWWESFGITQELLKKYNVYSCKNVFLNGSYLTSSSETDFIFAYYRGSIDGIDYFRIYFPMRKHFRFLSNWTAKMIQGAKQLPKTGDFLVITKSMKDVMTLASFGITAIAPNSETLFLSEEQYEKVKKRFKRIILLYDNDLAGISNMNKIRKSFKDISCVWIPRKYAKDISDFRKKYGEENTKKLINKAKRILNING